MARLPVAALLLAALLLSGCQYFLPLVNVGREAVTQPRRIAFEAASAQAAPDGGGGVRLSGTSTQIGLLSAMTWHRASLSGTTRTDLANGNTSIATGTVSERGISGGYPFSSLFDRRPVRRNEDSGERLYRRVTAPVTLWATLGAFDRTGSASEQVVDPAGRVVASRSTSGDGFTFRTGVQATVRPVALVIPEPKGALALLNILKVRGEVAYEFSPLNETLQSEPVVKDPTLPGLRLGFGVFLGL